MSFLDPQNPGISGFGTLTSAEEAFIISLASLAYQNGDIIYYNSGQFQRLPIGSTSKVLTVVGGLPAWATSSGGGGGGTLAATSLLSTDATKSTYRLTQDIPVTFISSATQAGTPNSQMMVFDPINDQITFNASDNPSANGYTKVEFWHDADCTEPVSTGEIPSWSTSTFRGTNASPAIVQTGDPLGRYTFYATNNTGSGVFYDIFSQMYVKASGSTAGDLGGTWILYTKADAGTLQPALWVNELQYLGINNPTPITRVHAKGDAAMLMEGAFGSGWTEPNLGAGTRMLWYPRKAAFRAGSVTGTQWDNANIGTNSIAFGNSSKASGGGSAAFGQNSISSGFLSTSFGDGTTASGDYSFAMGKSTTASGSRTFAGGDSAQATATYAFAWGTGSQATGVASVALGNSTFAIGASSLTSGFLTSADGQSSVALGEFTEAFSYGEMAVGLFNTSYTPSSTTTWVGTDRLYVIGNGDLFGTGLQSDAMIVLKNGNTTLNGSLNINQASGSPILSKGGVSLLSTYGGSYDTFLGLGAGNFTTTTAGYNTGVGYSTLPALTTGNLNTVIGAFAGHSLTTGTNNILIGCQAGLSITSGSDNVVIATNGGLNMTTAIGTVLVGTGAGSALTTAVGTTGVGDYALSGITSGPYNSGYGIGALLALSTATGNTGMGAYAFSSSNANYNTGVGTYAGTQTTSGTENTAMGALAYYYNITGSYGAAFGFETLLNSTGDNNSGFGWKAGYTNTSGTNNTYLGYAADANAGTYSYSTALGAGAIITASHQIVLGTTSEVVNVPNLTASKFVLTDSSKNLVSGTTAALVAAGVPVTVASADLTGQSATVASVTTTTAPNDGVSHTYLIGGYVTVTAISAGTVTLSVTYTDETSASRTATFFGEGLTTAAISGTGAQGFPPLTIRAKQNTAVTVVATFAGVSVTYDVGAFIQQIN